MSAMCGMEIPLLEFLVNQVGCRVEIATYHSMKTIPWSPKTDDPRLRGIILDVRRLNRVEFGGILDKKHALPRELFESGVGVATITHGPYFEDNQRQWPDVPLGTFEILISRNMVAYYCLDQVGQIAYQYYQENDDSPSLAGLCRWMVNHLPTVPDQHICIPKEANSMVLSKMECERQNNDSMLQVDNMNAAYKVLVEHYERT